MLRDDANFHNFRSVELMASHYRASAQGLRCFRASSLLKATRTHASPPSRVARYRHCATVCQRRFSGVRRAQNIAWSQHSVRRGIAYAKDGNYSFAMKCYEDAIEVLPLHSSALPFLSAPFSATPSLHCMTEIIRSLPHPDARIRHSSCSALVSPDQHPNPMHPEAYVHICSPAL